MGSFWCFVGWHRRSIRKRFRDTDGLVKSRCVRCGRRMLRDQPTGRWSVQFDRDARDPAREERDEMFGPIVFVIAIAFVLALAVLMRASWVWR